MRLELDIRKRLGTFMLDAQIESGGGVLVLFGPSGAGKSVTLQCVAGMMRPDMGRIAVDGDVLVDSQEGFEVAPQHRRIGYVPQSYALFPHLTVAENIAFGLRRWPRVAVRAEVGRLIELLHLGGLEGRRPAQLSGGQQQRVALARALAIGPQLLLLDEPFSAIDAIVRDVLREDLLRIHHELGVGVVVVTHDLADVNALADVVAVYHHGRVLQVGTRAEVFRQPATPAVARFTGARNLLAGRVVEADAAACRIAMGDVQIRATGPSTRVGEEVVVVIRPESARLLADGEEPLADEQVLPAVVCRAIPQGRQYAVEVGLGQQGDPKLEVVVPVWWWEQRPLAVGTACRMGVGSSAVHLLPAQLAEEWEESAVGTAGVV